MQFEPEVSYRITSGDPLHKWQVATLQIKAPPHVSTDFTFFVELPASGVNRQTRVKVDILIANFSWHTSVVEWFGNVLSVDREVFTELPARGLYDPANRDGSINFVPCEAFSEIAATTLW